MQKTIVNTAIIFICLIIGVIFFWWPKCKDFNNLRLNVEEKKTELANKEKYFSELNEVSSKLKEYSTELSNIEAALPSTSTIPELVNFISKKSSQNGLILENVNVEGVSPTEINSKIKKISLSLSLSGFYPAFKSFLYSLQKNARLIEVNSIVFSEPLQGEIFTFNLKIKTYSY